MVGGLMRAWSPAQRAGLVTLGIACAFLTAILYVEWTAPLNAVESAPAAPPASARKPSDEATSRYSMPPLQSFSAVTDRPLFSQSRRPSPEATDDASGPWSSFVLAGIVITPDSREALIRHGTPPTISHVHEGQGIEGWIVNSILADRVVLVGGGTQHELRLLAKPQANPPMNGPPRRPGAR